MTSTFLVIYVHDSRERERGEEKKYQIGFEDVVDNRSARKKRSNDYNAGPR